MKITILFSVMLLCCQSFSQPFVSVLTTSKGAGAQAGILLNGLELMAAYRVPYGSAELPTTLSVSAGMLIFITKKEKDNYSINTLIGIAHYRVKSFELYDKSGEILQLTDVKPIYNLELGKDSHLGRLFISVNYCEDLYFGFGMKVFFYRKKN